MNITLSGIDEKTDLDKLKTKFIDYYYQGTLPEIGILYTFSPDGRNRYPRKEWILENILKWENVSIHICGNRARQQLLNGELDNMLISARRIQINGKVDIDLIKILCSKYRNQIIITQHNEENRKIISHPVIYNHEILIDGSGGNGIVPAQWPILDIDNITGYAGGLNKSNIYEQINKIKEIDEWNDLFLGWIDAESSLRDENDWFSMDAAYEFVETAISAYKKIYYNYENI